MDELIELMKVLGKQEDTVWLNDYTTVFDYCWNEVEVGEGLGRLEKLFPECF